jgi:sialate O-acetylesterase
MTADINKNGRICLGIAVIVIGLAVRSVRAEVILPPVFGHHMVLQREMSVPVWGWASPGEKVTVTFDRQKQAATAGADGKWSVTLPPLKAGGPYELVAQGGNRVAVTNVLVGEVWICSGQSNMEWPLAAAQDAEKEVAGADYPDIRMFTVRKTPAGYPQESCQGEWAVCNPDMAPGFSAVGYFFARHLRRQLGVPVGMIHSSWSGTAAESWTALEALKQLSSYTNRAVAYEKTLLQFAATPHQYNQTYAALLKKTNDDQERWLQAVFAGDRGVKEKWHDPATGVGEGWTRSSIPMPVQNNVFSNYKGVAWARCDVAIPADWIGKQMVLSLGPIDDGDVTYVNGVEVGRQYGGNAWLTPRKYRIPSRLVRGTNVTVAIEMVNTLGAIGVYGTDANFSLRLAEGLPEQTMPLAGGWSCRLGDSVAPNSKPEMKTAAVPGTGMGDPAALYNGMLAPLAPYAIRGAIWYQGESNVDTPEAYHELLPAMIQSWRSVWRQGDFPFILVQLANFMGRQKAPIEPRSWADLRDVQRLTSLQMSNVGMAVIIDKGDASDIHPRNKQDVGARLALWALANTYGRKDIVYSGPAYKDMKVDRDKAILTFANGGSGLDVRGGALAGFAIAGEDNIFHVGQALIEGTCVVVSSDKVTKPAAVRYGWANNPVGNLFNKEGLPASPFRTDSWPRNQVKAADERIVDPLGP